MVKLFNSPLPNQIRLLAELNDPPGLLRLITDRGYPSRTGLPVFLCSGVLEIYTYGKKESG